MDCKLLKGSDIKKYIKQIDNIYGLVEFTKKDKVEECEIKNLRILKINNKPHFILKNLTIPTLNLIVSNPRYTLPKVTVDMGAIPYVIKGSDVMRPGITKMEKFDKDSYILIVDENHDKPLAIGKTLFSSEEIEKMEKGKVIETIHYIGDEVWNSPQ
ncbi:DUF1947 domain-containing protein [Candidatus Micrarchaeota archaeon]|jgi:PUA domain protein|nr:DUF1947 domain-containing protein [Candidatus Micrarchaeota archaeon]